MRVQVQGKHLVVGDVVADFGEIISLTGCRCVIRNAKGETSIRFRPDAKLYLTAGPTFTRCIQANVDSAWKLDPPRPKITVTPLGA